MKKLMLIVMIVVMSVTCSTFAIAAQAPEADTVQPMYNYTSRHSTTLGISGGTATCKATLTGYSSVTKIVTTITLQKKSLLWWSDVKEWEVVTYSSSATVAKTHTVSSGTYRVKAVYTVYAGTSSEKITEYSSTVAY